jgi:hypothetical protein
MDPDAALNALITFVRNGEFTEAQQVLDDLRAWHGKGGYPPSDPRPGTPQPAAG